MDGLLSALFSNKVDERECEPLTDNSSTSEDAEHYDTERGKTPYLFHEYAVFAMLGVAMLWAWNMFLAAAPYFQKRFQSDQWVLENFQPTIISVSTFTNLTVMVILQRIQASASYSFRISIALVINMAVFVLMALSTSFFLDVDPPHHLVFVLFMVFASAIATGLLQNGAFAFAASFGRPEYTGAIMIGQGVAGILPPLVQIVSVLVAPSSPRAENQTARRNPSVDRPGPLPLPPAPRESSTAALNYFLTAVAVSGASLVFFVSLARRRKRIVGHQTLSTTSDFATASSISTVAAMSAVSAQEASEPALRRHATMVTLLRKLYLLAAAVFLCFVVAMFYPVMTSKIESVRPVSKRGPLFSSPVFVPLAFFIWNIGDLLGRVGVGALRRLLQCKSPRMLIGAALARILFLPMYMLCNVRGLGAAVPSDAFYLLCVQLPFGLTNGWLGANSMMASAAWVTEPEQEAAGGFMGLSLAAGLTVGSLLSFTAAGV